MRGRSFNCDYLNSIIYALPSFICFDNIKELYSKVIVIDKNMIGMIINYFNPNSRPCCFHSVALSLTDFQLYWKIKTSPATVAVGGYLCKTTTSVCVLHSTFIVYFGFTRRLEAMQ